MKKIFENVSKKMDCGKLVEFNGETNHVYLLIEYLLRLALSKIIDSLKGVLSRILTKNILSSKKSIGKIMYHCRVEVILLQVPGVLLLNEILKEYIGNQKVPD
jgi:putative transposase